MIGEMDIDGVFTPSLLIYALIALVIGLPVLRLMARLGVYRLVWHRGLFDVAFLLLVWGGVAAAATALVFPS
jgi:hypothetical protein